MTRQMPVFVSVPLNSDAIIRLFPHDQDKYVQLTLGCPDVPESMTLEVEDPAVLDRLSDIAGQAALVLRAKLAMFDAEDSVGGTR